jgi:hypothetical protein
MSQADDVYNGASQPRVVPAAQVGGNLTPPSSGGSFRLGRADGRAAHNERSAPAEVTCCCSTERAERTTVIGVSAVGPASRTTPRTACLATLVKPQPANTRSVPRNPLAIRFGRVASESPRPRASASSTAAVSNAGVTPIRRPQTRTKKHVTKPDVVVVRGVAVFRTEQPGATARSRKVIGPLPRQRPTGFPSVRTRARAGCRPGTELCEGGLVPGSAARAGVLALQQEKSWTSTRAWRRSC